MIKENELNVDKYVLDTYLDKVIIGELINKERKIGGLSTEFERTATCCGALRRRALAGYCRRRFGQDARADPQGSISHATRAARGKYPCPHLHQ